MNTQIARAWAQRRRYLPIGWPSGRPKSGHFVKVTTIDARIEQHNGRLVFATVYALPDGELFKVIYTIEGKDIRQ